MIDGDSTNYVTIEKADGGFMVEAKRSLDVDPVNEALELSITRFYIEDHPAACRAAEALWELAGIELARIGRRLEGKEE